MAQQLGDETYDGKVKDLARCSFVVCRDYVLYYDEEELVAMRIGLPDDPTDVPDWWFERG